MIKDPADRILEYAKQKMREELEAIDKDSTPNSDLFHYTKLDAANEISASKILRLTEIKHLQDQTEFSYGLNILSNVLNNFAKPDGRSLRAYFCQGMISEIKNYSFQSQFLFFVASFSNDKDRRYLWDQYGDEGKGVALGFPASLCVPKENSQTTPDKQYYGGFVSYDEEDARQYFLETLEKIAWPAIEQFSNENQDEENIRPFMTRLASTIAILFLFKAIFVKKNCYQLENEYRLVATLVAATDDRYIKEDPVSGKRYIEMSFDSFSQIILGPNNPCMHKQISISGHIEKSSINFYGKNNGGEYA